MTQKNSKPTWIFTQYPSIIRVTQVRQFPIGANIGATILT